MHRIVLDTNIFVSALLSPQGPPWRLVDAWLDQKFDLISAPEQLTELYRVLDYDHLRGRIERSRKKKICDGLRLLAEMVDDLPPITDSCDPDDNIILAIAVSGDADWIVSGDKPGLLALGHIKNIPIMTAKDAVERLRIMTQC